MISILLFIPKLLSVVAVMFLLFCLKELHRGGQVFIRRTKPAERRLVKNYQLLPWRELLQIDVLCSVYDAGKEVSYTFHETYGAGHDLKDSWRFCKADLKKFFGLVWGWLWPILAGFAVALAWFAVSETGMSLWLGLVFLIMMLLLQVALIIWWFKNGSNWREYLVFAGVMIIVNLAASNVVRASMALWQKSVFWTSVFSLLPVLILWGGLGVCLINAVYAYAKYFERNELKILSMILTGILAIWLIIMLLTNIHL